MAISTTALTTLATLKSLLNITDGSQDARLEMLINGASESIENYCGRKFARQVGIVELRAEFGTTDLYLERNPVEVVTSVTRAGVVVDATTYDVDLASGRLYRNAGWQWSAVEVLAIEPYGVAGTEKKSLSIVYTGGYSLPQDNRALGTGLPYDLEEACLALCAYRKKMSPKNVGLSAEQAGNASRSFSGGKAPGWPEYISAMLDPYARIR